MDAAHKELIHFAQSAHGLDDSAKLKLILFAAGVKPATFFALKIDPQNLDEKEHLERHLVACDIRFTVGKPRAYEEITGITGNAVRWKIKGTWYGYDVFKDARHENLFAQYVALVKRQKHAQADRVSGRLYDYPRCCVEHYIKEHDLAFLRKHYTHHAYYERLHELERAFPLLMHTACSARCAASKRMNARYAVTLKRYAPKFWKAFSVTKRYEVDVVVDTESELLQDVIYGIRNSTPVFPVKDGHEYALITLKPLGKHYYLLNYLTRQSIERGTVLPATVTTQYIAARVTLGKAKRVINDLHHERHFVLL